MTHTRIHRGIVKERERERGRERKREREKERERKRERKRKKERERERESTRGEVFWAVWAAIVDNVHMRLLWQIPGIILAHIRGMDEGLPHQPLAVL